MNELFKIKNEALAAMGDGEAIKSVLSKYETPVKLALIAIVIESISKEEGATAPVILKELTDVSKKVYEKLGEP